MNRKQAIGANMALIAMGLAGRIRVPVEPVEHSEPVYVDAPPAVSSRPISRQNTPQPPAMSRAMRRKHDHNRKKIKRLFK